MKFIQKFLDIFRIKTDEENILSDQEYTIKENENIIDINNIYNKIEEAQKLAEIVNTTLDENEFFYSLNEVKNILKMLVEYEDKVDFEILPSENLRIIEKNEFKIIQLFNNRCEKKNEDIEQKENINDIEEKNYKDEENEIIEDEFYKEENFDNDNENDIDDNVDIENKKEQTNVPYRSEKIIIKGLHIYFIEIARKIINQKGINKIPLMREYHLSESELKDIISEIKKAKILDSDYNVIMGIEEFEKFIDIYEPSIFEFKNSVFDKEIFMCIGEIIFDKGVKDTYNSLSADEVMEYLNLMENLKIISYDISKNDYNILISKDEFYKICDCIPNLLSNIDYVDSEDDYKNVNFDNLSGIDFEKYCSYVLSKNKFNNIKITPPCSDHGIDILAEKDGITYAIQCKCYSSNVGNSAIQQAHTGKSLYHKDVAVVMTNRYFTKQAIDEAKELGVKLWNRDKLNELNMNNKY